MKKYHFKFICHGFDETTFTLLQFDGVEKISQLYQFNIELSTTNTKLDSNELIQSESRLEIYHDNLLIRTIHGVLVALEESKFLADGVLYKAQLAPKIWLLNQYETNEVYLAQNIQETIETILKEMGLDSEQYRFDLIQKYRSWSFRLQYRESHFDFLQRIIEREGIYYYFEQLEDTEVIVFCDALQMVDSFSQQALTFQNAGGINIGADIGQISSFICRRQSLPNRITLRDFNEESPSLDVRGEADIEVKGVGEINIYGLNIESPEEGERLAEIHANAYRCRANEYMGESQSALMSSGYSMKIQQHPKTQYNEQEYLIVEIHHTGSNPDAFRQDKQGDPIPEAYHNHFIAVDTTTEFAPRLQSVKPEIKGTLNAVIDAEATGEYAELDEYGRYKVKLPFDRRNEDDGKASHWVRMMQPYGGSGEGMHFPLRKGTRVLLSFIGGDPDRPVIAGTISDCGEQASIVNATNQTNSMIKTAGGNKIEIEDKEGSNRIKLETPHNSTYMHLGSPNHDGNGITTLTLGLDHEEYLGGRLKTIVARNDLTTLFPKINYKTFNWGFFSLTLPVSITTKNETGSSDDQYDEQKLLFKFNQTNIASAGGELLEKASDELSGNYIIERIKGAQYSWNEGKQYNFFASAVDNSKENTLNSNHYYFGTNWEVHCAHHNTNSSTNSAGAEFKSPDKLIQAMQGFNLKNVQNYLGQPEASWSDYLNKGRVRVAAHDTFTAQDGNIFDFGGYWNYNLGNSYTENHRGQNDAKINKVIGKDVLEKGGPYWGKMKTNPDDYFKKVTKSGNKFNWNYGDNVWTEKTYSGKAYDYQNDTDSIAINEACSSCEINFDCPSWEASYVGDVLMSEEKSGGGISESFSQSKDKSFGEYEKVDQSGAGKVTETRTYANGSPVSYEIVRQPKPGTSFSFKGDGLPTLSMSMETNLGDTSVALSVGAMSNSVEVNGSIMINSLETNLAAMKNEIELSVAALSSKTDIGAGTFEWEAKMGPLKAKSEAAALKVKQENHIEMMQKMLQMRKLALKIDSKSIEIDAKALGISSGFLKMFC